VYNRNKAIENIAKGYKKSSHMTKSMRKLRDTIMRMNRRSRKQSDVIQDKYKFKLKIQKFANVPETYAVEYSADVVSLLDRVKADTFVLKPIHLSRGIGIRTLTRNGNVFKDINGDELTITDLSVEAGAIYKQHRLNLTSINGVMAEEKLISHPDLQWYSDVGIADLRFMYFKNEFIMGMGRFPTKESGGYSNIARGATWGMFSSLGKFTHDPRYKSTQIENNKRLPFFIEMRNVGKKVVEQFGYLFQAVDMTVTPNGEVYVIESERTPQLEKYLTSEGIQWAWSIVEE